MEFDIETIKSEREEILQVQEPSEPLDPINTENIHATREISSTVQDLISEAKEVKEEEIKQEKEMEAKQQETSIPREEVTNNGNEKNQKEEEPKKEEQQVKPSTANRKKQVKSKRQRDLQYRPNDLPKHGGRNIPSLSQAQSEIFEKPNAEANTSSSSLNIPVESNSKIGDVMTAAPTSHSFFVPAILQKRSSLENNTHSKENPRTSKPLLKRNSLENNTRSKIGSLSSKPLDQEMIRDAILKFVMTHPQPMLIYESLSSTSISNFFFLSF